MPLQWKGNGGSLAVSTFIPSEEFMEGQTETQANRSITTLSRSS